MLLRLLLCPPAVAALMVLSSAAARAQDCTAQASSLDFGVVDTLSTSSADSTSQVTVRCTGRPRSTVYVCLHIGDGSGGSDSSLTPRYLRSGANTLSFDLFTDPGRTNIWGSGVFPTPSRGPLQGTVVLSGGGSGSQTFTMYGRVFGGQPTTTLGTYSSNFSGSHTLLNYSYTQRCGGIKLQPAFGFQVTAQVNAKCLVGGANILDFGSRGLLNGNADSSTTIDMRCTPGTPYTIALGAGTGPGATITNRRMRRGAETIAYQLYTNSARTNVWGDGSTGSVVGGTGTGNPPSPPHTVYGRVPPQSTPPAGTYTDTVVITVTY
ncbi:spore coat U domain-containing protein [Inquilinus limosus]|uniref:Csu type fimbrial protein n=1 Tax=Inquilinus limosus TaxID=171674 RepID=UPI003F156FEC